MEITLSNNTQAEEIIMVKKTPFSTILLTYFITIAAVLGTGILALPVKLAKSGFTPLLVTYSIGFIMQSMCICFMVELLQRAQALEDSIPTSSTKHVALVETQPSDSDLGTINETVTPFNEEFKATQGPDLHFIGNLFLGRYQLIFFEFALLTHFFTIMVAYGLGGSQAYNRLLVGNEDTYIYFIAPLIFLLSSLIIFGSNILKGIVNTLTSIKGTLLVVMVIITGIAGYQINLPIINNWVHIGQPFLIGTVALGGAVGVLPVVYGKILPTVTDIKRFRLASILGLFTVFILNIFWSYYVLLIVPQSSTDPNQITLERAEEKGQIATIPLIQTITKEKPSLLWIAILIDFFIVISLTVSFIVVGSGYKHLLDGYSRALGQTSESNPTGFGHIRHYFSTLPLNKRRFALYIIAFLSIYIAAQVAPQSLFNVLEIFTSLAMNFAFGYFITNMLRTARSPKFSVSIPVALSNRSAKLSYVVAVYFLFAALYDIIGIIVRLSGGIMP